MKRTLILLFIISTAFLEYENLEACSVCRCDEGMQLCSCPASDQNSQALNGLPDKGKLRFQFENLLLAKSNGLSPDPIPAGAAAKLAQVAAATGTESEREIRPALRASYGLTNSLTIAAELPYSFKRIQEQRVDGASLSSSSGLGDAELSLAWSGPIARRKTNNWTIGFGATMKIPTGKNDLFQGGSRVDEHLQPGTGSYDWQVGSALTRISATTSWHLSAYVRTHGTNNFAYHYGDDFLYNLGWQRRVSSIIAATAQFNGRYASRDLQSGASVDNTGGSVVYFTPGIRLRVTPRASFVTNVQIPIYENLYGIQSEKAVLNTGVSLDL